MSGCLLAAWRYSEYAHSVFNSCLCVRVWKEAQRETLNDEVWVYAPFARSQEDIISYKLEDCRRLWMNSRSSKPSAEAVTLKTTWEWSLTHHPAGAAASVLSLESCRFSMEARYSF